MRRLILISVSVLVLMAASVAVGYRSNQDNPHDFTDNDCFFCHFTLPRSGEPDGQPLRFTDKITNLCARCHDMSGVISHQVDILPSAMIKVPKDMPLDEEGKITCVTCHDIHKPFKNPLTGERSFFLRRETAGKGFCLSCHESAEAIAQIRLASQGGAPGQERVTHRPAMDKGHGFAKFEVLDPSSELDDLSLACLDCHNEPGSGKKTTIGTGVWKHAKEGIGLSHPVGVDYYRASIDNKDLVPERELNKRLKLFKGRIGCCTCHDPYSPGGGEALVIGDRDNYQDLCFACHKK